MSGENININLRESAGIGTSPGDLLGGQMEPGWHK